MKLKKFFKNAGLEKIKLGPKWARAEISFQTPDRDAAWELYIEMLTRIVTQPSLDTTKTGGQLRGR